VKYKWYLKKLPGGGWEGCVSIPLRDGAVENLKCLDVIGEADDKAVALAKAAAVARMVQDQLAAHPALAAILPPGTGLALQAINGIAKSAIAGKLEEALSHHVGPAIHRLGRALGRFHL